METDVFWNYLWVFAEHVWLGRVMPNPAWGGQGVLRNVNVTGSAVSYEMGIEVQNSEVAICSMV